MLDLLLLIPIVDGDSVAIARSLAALVADSTTPVVTIDCLDSVNPAESTFDALVLAEHDLAGIGSCPLRPGGWLVVVLAPPTTWRAPVKVSRCLAAEGFDRVVAYGTYPSALDAKAFAPLDAPIVVGDLFATVVTPLTFLQEVRARWIRVLVRMRLQRLAFRSFLVVARRAA